MELHQDIFIKCLSLHSVDIAQDHRWRWAYLCGKQIQGKKSLSCLGLKIWSKIGPIIKNVATWSSFMHAIKKKYFTLSAKLILVLTVFLLGIIGILLSHPSYFKF